MTISAHEVALLEAERPPLPVSGVAMELPANTHVEPHHHNSGQLVFASSGVMVVDSSEGSWVIPPQRAMWIPAAVNHRLSTLTTLSLRNLLISPDHSGHLPQHCRTLRVGGLLREIIIRLSEEPELCLSSEHRGLVDHLLFHEMRDAAGGPLALPHPKSERLKRICAALMDDPADDRPLEHWASVAAVSPRTLARQFLKETGMSLAAWRRQLRMLHALTLLGQGQSVTTVALDVGYESTSAFIEVFKRSFGETPARYFN
ncbi:MAG: helix-turn-helix transcriptional regulator [Flavobacteriaceae bacterium]